jgi:UDPglucose--hexose-1-phosphate uridylyltransferase
MNELRQDLTSGDWMLLSPGRATRPKFLDEKRKSRKPSPKKACPFEDLEKSGNWPPLFMWPSNNKWQVAVIPNKYPAVARSATCSVPFAEEIYSLRTAVGTHDLLITRDHDKHFIDLSKERAVKVFSLLRDFHALMTKDKCAAYISSFYNYGSSAGASIWHPHYQILTLPIIPPHAAHSLKGASDYFKKNSTCARCDIIAFEKKKKVRVIAENDHAIALTPFASKRPFEVRVMPKKHISSFRETSDAITRDVALLLQDVMKRMIKYLNDPDLNFFIHDTPLDGKDYGYHHWHIEVIPKISIDAGFEISTGIEINIIDPDNAAATLRGSKVAYHN